MHVTVSRFHYIRFQALSISLSLTIIITYVIASAHHGIETLVGHIGRRSTILYIFYHYITELSSVSCLRKCHFSDIPRLFWGLNLVSPHATHAGPHTHTWLHGVQNLTHRDQHWKIHINLVSELISRPSTQYASNSTSEALSPQRLSLLPCILPIWSGAECSCTEQSCSVTACWAKPSI